MDNLKTLYTKLEVYPKNQDDSEQAEIHTFYEPESEQRAIARAKEILSRQPDKRIYIGVHRLFKQ